MTSTVYLTFTSNQGNTKLSQAYVQNP